MDKDQLLQPIPAQAEGDQVLPGDKTEIAAPSGLVLKLQDVVWNAPGPDGLTLRFRFVAPALAGADEETIASTVRRHALAVPDLCAAAPAQYRAATGADRDLGRRPRTALRRSGAGRSCNCSKPTH